MWFLTWNMTCGFCKKSDSHKNCMQNVPTSEAHLFLASTMVAVSDGSSTLWGGNIQWEAWVTIRGLWIFGSLGFTLKVMSSPADLRGSKWSDHRLVTSLHCFIFFVWKVGMKVPLELWWLNEIVAKYFEECWTQHCVRVRLLLLLLSWHVEDLWADTRHRIHQVPQNSWSLM